MQASPTQIGLISDTHGLLRPQALEALRGSELILHAGDVGKGEILTSLRELAPVIAVRGNVDTSDWARTLPETAVAEAGKVLLYVLHDVHALDLNPRRLASRLLSVGILTSQENPNATGCSTSTQEAQDRAGFSCL